MLTLFRMAHSAAPRSFCSDPHPEPGSLLNKKGGGRCHLLLDKRWHLTSSLLSNKPGSNLFKKILGQFCWRKIYQFLSCLNKALLVTKKVVFL
jgi:hypothetical protein